MSSRSPSTWSAPVGGYSFEVSVYSGSYAQFASAPTKTDKAQAGKNATALRAALAEDGERHPAGTTEAVEKLEHSAKAVTVRVEHANKLFKALAEDRIRDPRLLTDEIGSLLGLLDRLDCEKRYEEEIRVAKALHGLCVLAFRWIDLVRSLRHALAAAEQIGDEAGQAWALNELGALHLCAGSAKRASEHLERASELYEKLGDAAGRCATRHNFDSARRDVARPVQLRAPRHLLTAGGSIRPLVAAIGGRHHARSARNRVRPRRFSRRRAPRRSRRNHRREAIEPECKRGCGVLLLGGRCARVRVQAGRRALRAL